jgi:hypothetical protein
MASRSAVMTIGIAVGARNAGLQACALVLSVLPAVAVGSASPVGARTHPLPRMVLTEHINAPPLVPESGLFS